MKLSDENYRRLTVLIWRERMRTWGPVLAGVVLLVTAFVAFQLIGNRTSDPVVDVTNSDATVTAVTPAVVGRGVTLTLRLTNGQRIVTTANMRVYPTQGSHVQVSDVRHASGRHTYSVVGTAQ